MNSLDFEPLRLGAGDSEYGRVYINNYTEFPTLTTGGPPTYKLYIHLEDMKYYGAVPEFTAVAVVQSGAKMSKGLIEKEYDFDARPLSSSALAVSKITKWVARGVPAVSAYASAASWFLEKTAGVLRAYGFSKPQIQDPITRIWKTSGALEHNIDVPSSTVLVAPFVSNHVPATPDFGFSDVDEMSLKYVLSQWNQVYYGNVATNTAANSLIYGTSTSPAYMWYRQTTGSENGNILAPTLSGATANALQPTGVFFWSQFFSYWRGGLKFRITFAKTKMHAGRVLAAFVPAASPSTATTLVPSPVVTGVNVPGTTGLSAVFDLKDSNVFEFECPYMLAVPFARFPETSGTFSIQVLDPILAPPSSATYIPFVVEVAAMDDFEFSHFCGTRFPAHAFGTVRLQSGMIMPSESSLVQPCAGEVFNSVKQLIMIPHWTQVAWITNQAITWFPWFYARGYPATVPGILGNAFRSQSYNTGGTIANCYLWAKGSTDCHGYLPLSEGQYIVRASTSPESNSYATPTAAPSSVWTSYTNSSTPWATERNGAFHFKFPLWNRVKRMSTTILNAVVWAPGTPAQNNAPAAYTYHPFPVITFNSVTTAAPALPITATLGRAAGDDAVLAHYMGPPPLVLPSTATANLPDPDSVLVLAFTPPAAPAAVAATQEVGGMTELSPFAETPPSEA
jgi:hypothetical protein